MAPNYSEFTPTVLAVRLEQGRTSDGKLKLEIELIMPAGSEILMIGMREAIQQLIRKAGGGRDPMFEEEYNQAENPEAYNESLESYYNRTAGGWERDSKRSN